MDALAGAAKKHPVGSLLWSSHACSCRAGRRGAEAECGSWTALEACLQADQGGEAAWVPVVGLALQQGWVLQGELGVHARVCCLLREMGQGSQGQSLSSPIAGARGDHLFRCSCRGMSPTPRSLDVGGFLLISGEKKENVALEEHF